MPPPRPLGEEDADAAAEAEGDPLAAAVVLLVVVAKDPALSDSGVGFRVKLLLKPLVAAAGDGASCEVAAAAALPPELVGRGGSLLLPADAAADATRESGEE